MENWSEFTRMFWAAFESQFHSGYRDFKTYWSHVFVFFLQNSFPIKIEMLNQTTHNKNLSFPETDIALIVPSDVNAIEPMACFENREWEYALVLTSYQSKWEYQRKWLYKLINQRHDISVRTLQEVYLWGVRLPASFQYFLHEKTSYKVRISLEAF